MSRFFKTGVVLFVVAAVVVASVALALASGPVDCPSKQRVCPRLYDPVVCADGVRYDNLCFAVLACAPTPCVHVEW